MTAGASLKPDSASSRPADPPGSGSTRRMEKTAAASVETRSRPGGAPAASQAEQVVRADGGDHRADADAERGEHTGGRDHHADVGDHLVVSPPSIRMTASAGGAEVLCQLGVVELDAEHVLAEHDARAEEQQQAGQANARRDPGGDDAGQHAPGRRPAALRTAAAGSFRLRRSGRCGYSLMGALPLRLG